MTKDIVMHESFELYVLYYQISVFNPDLAYPFNDWRPQHVQQGFSWRSESVSFGTIECGDVNVEVKTDQQIVLEFWAQRAIIVPYKVSASNVIEIATIVNSKKVKLDSGSYSLLYQHSFREEKLRCSFTFVNNNNIEPNIMIADPKLNPIYPLLMDAEPAT